MSSLCPCHLDLDPPPRHTPRPPRSTTTAITQHTAETPSNLQTNLRCHGVFARAACRRSVPVTWTSIRDNSPGQARQRRHFHLSLVAVISNSFPHTSRWAANGTSKNHVPAMRSVEYSRNRNSQRRALAHAWPSKGPHRIIPYQHSKNRLNKPKIIFVLDNLCSTTLP